MADIHAFALQRAEVAAARLWALASAPFPLVNGGIIQAHVEQDVTDTAIAFAIHVRRLLDQQPGRGRFCLDQPFRLWEPSGHLKKVSDLRDALNRIVHATEFRVGFERLPEATCTIEGGAVGVIYLMTRTDQRDEALIDVFAMAACFFHRLLPTLASAPQSR